LVLVEKLYKVYYPNTFTDSEQEGNLDKIINENSNSEKTQLC
jgi:hypothetical protein